MIKMLVMDVDGTLTDGKIFVSDQGEVMKVFDVKDGYGIKFELKEHGIIPAIITGKISEIVAKRAAALEKLPSSTTATKDSNCLKSMTAPRQLLIIFNNYTEN